MVEGPSPGGATSKILFGVSIAPGRTVMKKLPVGEQHWPTYAVGYIHIRLLFLSLYIATEKWRELGRKAIKFSRRSL